MDPDLSRQATTIPDSDFTLSIDEALEHYSRAGFPRTPRSIQRYCAKGHLQCRLIDTPFGEKYLIDPQSVEKHIAYIEEVTPTTGRDVSRPVAASPDVSRPVATDVARNYKDDLTKAPGATTPDEPRQGTTAPDLSRYVARLESENEFLRGQVVVKDSQIAALSEHAKQTTTTLGALQRLIAPLIGSPDPYRSASPERTSTDEPPSQP